jgi:hypothetical protein
VHSDVLARASRPPTPTVVPCEDPPIGARPSTRLLLTTGDRLNVAGAIDEVEKPLQDAARSSPGTLAWLKDADSGESVGVNPVHVVTLTPAPDEPSA